MAQISIKISETESNRVLGRLQERILRKIGGALPVVQLEQVGMAFDRQGQPGTPWKRLWADTFVGEVSTKDKTRVAKAATAHARAMGRLDNLSFTAKPERREKILADVRQKNDRLDKALAKAVPATSYRKDGEILSDTGLLKGSFNKRGVDVSGDSVTSTIATPHAYGAYQHYGFKTEGPNFIPITLKARRHHVKGMNPKDEGLEYGVDYIMAWHGVTVPARPIIDYANETNKQQIETVASEAMAGA